MALVTLQMILQDAFPAYEHTPLSQLFRCSCEISVSENPWFSTPHRLAF
jgi:hypothetical protein